jgi:hypothetical protein
MHDIAHTTPDAGWEWMSEVCSDGQSADNVTTTVEGLRSRGREIGRDE